MAKQKPGKLTVIHGPMFSGKTTTLIDIIKHDKSVLAFKPSLDDRYSKKSALISHDRKEANAIMVNASKPNEILKILEKPTNKKVTTVLIDESNFFDDKLIDTVKKIINQKKSVVIAGLALDSEQNDFGPTKKLSKIADRVETLFAKCDYAKCKIKAKYTYAKKPKATQLVVGAGDLYGATCLRHYKVLHHPPKPKSALIEFGVYPPFVDWLDDMDFPYLRVSTKPSQFPRIEVGADSMRIGKTTAVKIIAEGLKAHGYKVTVSEEDIKNNPNLKKSYSDPTAALLKSQKWFAKRKFEQINAKHPNNAFVQDVHPEMDYCYAVTNALMGRMSLKQFEEYKKYYHSLNWKKTNYPDLLVYLKASDPILVNRAQTSARDYETIEPEYFMIMKTVNRRWLDGIKKKIKVLEIDTDNFDYSLNSGTSKNRQKLVSMVRSALKVNKNN